MGNISKKFSADNKEKAGLYGNDSSVDYDRIDVDDISAIHKYLRVKNNMK